MSVEEGLPQMSVEQLKGYLARLEQIPFPCHEYAQKYAAVKQIFERDEDLSGVSAVGNRFKVTISTSESRFTNPLSPGKIKQVDVWNRQQARLMRLVFLCRSAHVRGCRTPVDTNGLEGGAAFCDSLRKSGMNTAYLSDFGVRGKGGMADLAANTKLCSKCGTVKALSDFGRKSGTEDCYRGECKTCAMPATDNPGAWFGSVYTENDPRPHVRSMSEIYGTENTKNHCANAVADQLRLQEYREPYSGKYLIDFTLRDSEIYHPTIDRTDQENNSYAPGEFVVTIRLFQIGMRRQWSRELYEEYRFLRNIAHLYEPMPMEAYKQVKAGAEDLLKVNVLHTKKRAGNGDVRAERNIDEDYIARLYYTQRGLCAIGGTPIEPMLKGDHCDGKWSWSLDRIDNTLGYIHGNVRLVWVFLNTVVKLTSADIDNVFGVPVPLQF